MPNNFKQDLDSLFNNFLKAFEDWVEDFEDFALHRKEASNISPRFLERHAKILINAYDELLLALTEEYEDILLEYNQLSTLEKKKETEERLVLFKTRATTLIHRANVKAQLLLEDFQKHPFSSDMTVRLKEISNFSYENLLNLPRINSWDSCLNLTLNSSNIRYEVDSQPKIENYIRGIYIPI